VKTIDRGHHYRLRQLGGGEQDLIFVKRSGGAVRYRSDHAGVQTQEVLRALIDRCGYLDSILPCAETKSAAWHLRMALFEFEARAHRRKAEKKNRRRGAHRDDARPRPWRPRIYDDVPFDEHLIERRRTGPDGHIVIHQP
jgi:hypothetical protein